MASITLAEASKLGLDDLTAGVIENIVTVDALYSLLPFQPINGNALTYNRENALGDAQVLAVDGTITATAAATFTKVTTGLTTIIGDAYVNGLIQAQNVGGNAGNDVVAVQIASKAKSIARSFQDQFINGDGTGNTFTGLSTLVAAGQTIAGGSAALDFGMLDELIQSVKTKGSTVDFIAMPAKGIRKLNALLRALGGTTADWVEINGVRQLVYNGVVVLRNDWIPTNLGTGTDESIVFAGNWDDGSQSVGIAGLTSSQNMGIHVQNVGPSETKDNDIWRVKFYAGLANYSNLGLAAIKGVKF